MSQNNFQFDTPACQTGASWTVVSGPHESAATKDRGNGQDDRECSRYYDRLAANPRGIVPKDTLGRSCSASLNCRMPPGMYLRWCEEGARQRASLPDFVICFRLAIVNCKTNKLHEMFLGI